MNAQVITQFSKFTAWNTKEGTCFDIESWTTALRFKGFRNMTSKKVSMSDKKCLTTTQLIIRFAEHAANSALQVVVPVRLTHVYFDDVILLHAQALWCVLI
jgi:hypothetical protein